MLRYYFKCTSYSEYFLLYELGHSLLQIKKKNEITRLPRRENAKLEVCTLVCAYQLLDFQPILIPPVPKCLPPWHSCLCLQLQWEERCGPLWGVVQILGDQVRWWRYPPGSSVFLLCNSVGSWVQAASLVLFTFQTQTSPQDYLNRRNENIAFHLEIKNVSWICALYRHCLLLNSYTRKTKSYHFCWKIVLITFLSLSIKNWSARLLLIILLATLIFNHFLYTGCAWKMGQSLHQPRLYASSILPPLATCLFCPCFVPALSYQSCQCPT